MIEAFEKLRRWLTRNDLTMVDDRDLIAEFLRLFQIVGRQDDGCAGLVQRAHIGPELAAQLHVHARGRLIQDQNRRCMDQCFRHHETSLHAAGQLADIGIFLVQQAHRIKNGLRAAL